MILLQFLIHHFSFVKLLPKLFSNGHKVLIFSQMVRVLDLIEELLRIKKYRYERLDGSTSSSARTSAVDRFTRKSCQRFVMLLSTRAGGLGLNLTGKYSFAGRASNGKCCHVLTIPFVTPSRYSRGYCYYFRQRLEPAGTFSLLDLLASTTRSLGRTNLRFFFFIVIE